MRPGGRLLCSFYNFVAARKGGRGESGGRRRDIAGPEGREGAGAGEGRGAGSSGQIAASQLDEEGCMLILGQGLRRRGPRRGLKSSFLNGRSGLSSMTEGGSGGGEVWRGPEAVPNTRHPVEGGV